MTATAVALLTVYVLGIFIAIAVKAATAPMCARHWTHRGWRAAYLLASGLSESLLWPLWLVSLAAVNRGGRR